MTTQSILESLKESQRADGAFPGVSITSFNIVSSAAIFGTALAGSLLTELSENNETARQIIARLIPYLKRQERIDGSYAYWEHGSYAAKKAPYPPDLDDTSLAAAIRIGSQDFGGESIAKFAKLLVNSEVSEGGPYNTWILEIKDPRWKDVDLAVNANIAYTLDRLGIQLPNLQSMFENAITSSDYRSRYYHIPLMVLFLISRAYHGSKIDTAIEYILAQQKPNGCWGSGVETGCALCTLANFGVSLVPYEQAITSLISELQEPMAFDALYTERVCGEDTTHYANRSVFKSLIALAVYRFEKSKLPPELSTSDSDTMKEFEQAAISAFVERCSAESQSFKELAQEHIQKLLLEPISKDAARLPKIFGDSLIKQKNISDETVATLAQAHLFGWIGYKIMDAAADGEDTSRDNAFSEFCIKNFSDRYHVLFSDEKFHFFSNILDDMKAAFDQERRDAIRHTQQGFLLASVPQDEPVSWQKSIGHALPTLALILLSGYSIKSEAYAHTKSFFQDFLHARQLHDDAHDLIEDLASGKCTVIGKQVLARFMEIHPDRIAYALPEDSEELHRIFWQDCYPGIHEQIGKSIQSARAHLDGIPLSDATYFKSILEGLDRAQKKASDEHACMLSFLTAY